MNHLPLTSWGYSHDELYFNSFNSSTLYSSIYYFEQAETFDSIINEPLSTAIIKNNDIIKLYNIK